MFRMFASSKRAIPLLIAANTSDYNVFTAAGSPTDAVDVVLTINAGVTVRGIVNPAIRTTSAFAAGSTLKVINSGSILGFGGAGGAGGNAQADGLALAGATNGSAGVQGGTAIDSRIPIAIDNTSVGQIFGGGGGGGGGGGDYEPVGFIAFGGSSGGGGVGGTGGAAGVVGTGLNGGSNGTVGTAGTSGAAGQGGGQALGGRPANARGGNGGTYGLGGDDGEGGFGHPTPAAGVHGSVGYSVFTAGLTISWIAGNTGAQVKGPTA